MLTVILYGRNDAHGYNLHKRTALGLNCLAELLSDGADEILFVDYNTPDDFPTLPESIADTLTTAAASRLRILRVRPATHAAFRERTHLAAIEPIARNVAIRRSRADNDWILSTNPDMIFVPRGIESIDAMVASLPRGFYQLPRFELPESLWEGLDRLQPRAAIESVREFGESFALNEVVHGPEFIRFDAPGDFQLATREDLFRINGFDERMLLGWHVDSNLSRRFLLLHGEIGDASHGLLGYHCNHTRQATGAHQHRAASNDFGRFVEQVRQAEVPEQAETWGLPSVEIEEIRLARSMHRQYLGAMRATLAGHTGKPPDVRFVRETFDETRYDAPHVMPFIADLFASVPRHWSAGWVGSRADTFELFCSAWRHLGFTGTVVVPDWASDLLVVDRHPDVRTASVPELSAAADIVLIDFGLPSHSRDADVTADDRGRVDEAADRLIRRDFGLLVRAERHRLADGAAPRRFVCVGAVHTSNESAVLEEIAAAATPFGSRLRHGFVKARPERYAEANGLRNAEANEPNLIDMMRIGEAGERTPHGVRAPFGRRGIVLHGPHTPLPGGRYRALIDVAPSTPATLLALARPIVAQVATGDTLIADKRLRFALRAKLEVPFVVPAHLAGRAPIHVSLFRGRYVDFVVTGVSFQRLAVLQEDAGAEELVRRGRARKLSMVAI